MAVDGPPAFNPRKEKSSQSPTSSAQPSTASSFSVSQPVATPQPESAAAPQARTPHVATAAAPTNSTKSGFLGLGIPGWVLGLCAVAALLVGGGLAWLVLGAGGNDVLVAEPRSNGEVDLHLLGLGDALNNETEVEGGVQLAGSFREIIARELTLRPSNSLDHAGGQLIGIRDGDETTLSLVRDGELIEIEDGDGDLSVTKTLDDSVIAIFNDFDDNRCSAYLITDIDAERLARGDDCYTYVRDWVLIHDNDDVSVVNVSDFSEIELGEADNLVLGGDGLVVLQNFEDDGESELEIFELANLEESQSVSIDDDEFVAGKMTEGVLVGARDEDLFFDLIGSPISRNGEAFSSLTWVSAADGSEIDVIASGNAASLAMSPDHSAVVIFESEDFDRDEDFAVSVWNQGSLQPTAARTLDGFQIAVWLSNEAMILVDQDGVVWQLDLAGNLSEVGELDDFDPDESIISNATRTFDGDLIIEAGLNEDSNRHIYWIVSQSEGVTPITEAASLRLVSTDAYPNAERLIFSLWEDSGDDEFQLVEWTGDDLVEFDEADGFFGYSFEGSDLVYTASTGDDHDDLEVRRYQVGSNEDPTSEFEEVAIISPGFGDTMSLTNSGLLR